MKKNFQLVRPATQVREIPAKPSEEKVNAFVRGREPTMAKTFNIPIRLARELRKVATAEDRTDTAIIVDLIEQYVKEHSDK
jgi:hypothetical protein